jgi:hypothetical protein
MNILRLAIIALTMCPLFSITTDLAQESKSGEPKPPKFANGGYSLPWSKDGWNIQRLGLDNPDKQLIYAEVATLVAGYKKSGFATASVAEPVQLKTSVLRRFFPNHRFYLIGWDEHPVRGKRVMGLGFGLFYTFIIGPGNEITRLSGTGNFEDFGKFLSQNSISITSSEDARLVWLAFCDIHQKLWHSRDLKQLSATEWYLGLHQNDWLPPSDQYYFLYRITLDDKQRVTSAILRTQKTLE